MTDFRVQRAFAVAGVNRVSDQPRVTGRRLSSLCPRQRRMDMSDNGSKTVPEALVGQWVSRSAYDEALNAIVAGDKRLEAAKARADAAEQMAAELRAVLVRRHAHDVAGGICDTPERCSCDDDVTAILEQAAPIAGRWCLASELAARVKVLEAENERLREACTLALGIMEQKNRVTVLPTAKFVDVKFDQEDIAVLRAAMRTPEKRAREALTPNKEKP